MEAYQTSSKVSTASDASTDLAHAATGYHFPQPAEEKRQVSTRICLRTCYAMSVSYIAYRCAMQCLVVAWRRVQALTQ
eukprot:2618931-Rhodomonas_salina.2